MSREEAEELQMSWKGLGLWEGVEDLKPFIQSGQKDGQQEMSGAMFWLRWKQSPTNLQSRKRGKTAFNKEKK